MIAPKILEELRQIVGESHVLVSPEALACYGYDAAPVTGEPDVVVLPGSTEEVAAIVKLANRELVPVVPRGSGTNLSGGVVPIRGGIVLPMNRMDRILEIDRANLTATLQPGVVTGQFQAEVEKIGLFYPPDPASNSVSTIGGNVAESSGGPRGFKYGTTKDYVLSLEVVLPTGEVIRTGGKTVKNVAGYDLNRLFVGSEGTLGVVTEIIVRLIPLPESRQTLLAIFDNLDDAAETVSAIVAARIIPCTIELMDQTTITRVEAYKPVGLPTDADALLLIEVDGSELDTPRQAQKVAEIARAHRAREVRVAHDKQQQEELWVARRSAFAAVGHYRPTAITEDATVPRDKVPAMVRRLRELGKKYRLETAILGHAGDGNLHPFVMTDVRDKEEMERTRQFFSEVFKATLEYGGTITGEHGVGLMKAPYMEWQFGPDGVEVMRRIKKSFDPNNILNPGKILPE